MTSPTWILTGLVVLSISWSACADDALVVDNNAEQFEAVLDNTGNNVIVNTYDDLQVATAALQLRTDALRQNPTAANLTAAREAWVAARSPWEQSEGFLFGPVDQEGLDPSIDSWPVNVTDLNNVLASSQPLTVDFLRAQEGTLKGFHTIEFLLWGDAGDKTVSSFTARQFEYLDAAAGALAADTEELFMLWSPTGGNFIEHVTLAGRGSRVYTSQKSAIEELANSIIVIADEVGNGKINDPLVQRDLSLEESRFSANSKADFSDNIRSIRNIYTGRYGNLGNGRSLSEIVEDKDATLDAQIRAEIETAITTIISIPGTFTEAVTNDRVAVEAAQTSVRQLQATLESRLLPLINAL